MSGSKRVRNEEKINAVPSYVDLSEDRLLELALSETISNYWKDVEGDLIEKRIVIDNLKNHFSNIFEYHTREQLEHKLNEIERYSSHLNKTQITHFIK